MQWRQREEKKSEDPVLTVTIIIIGIMTVVTHF